MKENLKPCVYKPVSYTHLGLGYPGGPKVDKLSKEGNPNAIEFPKAKIGDCPYDFSFSGVKSIDMLLDKGSFNELDKFVNHRCTNIGMEKKQIDVYKRQVTNRSK